MPQLPYKYFGGPKARNDSLNRSTEFISEYNNYSSTYMLRVNDVYIYCPAFGEDDVNAVIWTPAFRRTVTDTSTGIALGSRINNLSVEELLIPNADVRGINSSTPSSSFNVNRFNYSTLEANGITLYIKIRNEPDTGGNEAPPDVRELISGTGLTLQAITRVQGVCAFNGSIATVGIGNTFSLNDNDAFCIGLRMDKTCGTTGNSRGRYFYYVVNRNTNNDAEIIWRICFNIGLNSNNIANQVPTAGTTLPYGTYVIPNPVLMSSGVTLLGITFTNSFFPLGLYYQVARNTFDNTAFYTFPTNPQLEIDYSNIVDFQASFGTDSPISPEDFRPYTINSVPVS